MSTQHRLATCDHYHYDEDICVIVMFIDIVIIIMIDVNNTNHNFVVIMGTHVEVWCMLAGYTIHTVVALAHAGLIPLEHQQAVQQAFQQCAPLLSTTPDTVSALVDKSLPTMIGLGGIPSYPVLSLIGSS